MNIIVSKSGRKTERQSHLSPTEAEEAGRDESLVISTTFSSSAASSGPSTPDFSFLF